MADVALAVLAPLAVIGAVALVGGAVWLWRRGGRPDQETPADEWGELAVARSERHAAELAELRRRNAHDQDVIAAQREVIADLSQQIGQFRLAEKAAARARTEDMDVN